jgi:surface polysaccharide O-acyltransferase-like enzyme
MLLVFDFTAVGLLAIAPKWGERIGALASRGDERPARFFAIVLILSALAYVPLALAYGGGTWTQWGLIAFQTSRPAHYFVYFIMGVAVGVHGLRKGLLSHDGALARRWWIWAFAAAGFGALVVFLAVAPMTSKGAEQSVFVYAGDLAFAPICATLSFALLAVFARFVQRSNPMVDSLAANSYGIYIVHYAFVAWLQFALLHASLSGTEKWGFVAFGAYATSWFATAAARRLPGVARII